MNHSSVYYIYNNIAIMACTITAILHRYEHVTLSRIAMLVPFLLDDNISEKIIKQNYRSFEALTQQNRVALANFNDRYNDLLPQIMDGIAVLLDMNIVTLHGDSARLRDEGFYEALLQDNESERLKTILTAVDKLMPLIENLNMSKAYSTLNILL